MVIFGLETGGFHNSIQISTTAQTPYKSEDHFHSGIFLEHFWQ